METQEIITLSARAERLGWQLPASRGAHLVDLLGAPDVADLIALLAERREPAPAPVSAFPQQEPGVDGEWRSVV